MELLDKWMTGRTSPLKKLTSMTLSFLTLVCLGASAVFSYVFDDPLLSLAAAFLAILPLSGVLFYVVEQRQQFMEKFGFNEGW